MHTENRLPTDPLLLSIADYAAQYEVSSDAALQAARLCLLDSLACAFEALDHADCTRLIGPVIPGGEVTVGARVPGTQLMLDPVKATFDIATLVRWLDLSDTWIATQTTHPSDDLGAVLAVCDYLSRSAAAAGRAPVNMRTLLAAMTRAHEIQGGLGAHIPITRHGIDNVFLTKIACAAVVAQLLGCDRDRIAAAVSLAFFEPSLAVHRFGSNTGPRKGWAGGDASADGVRFAMMAAKGEPGYPQVLTHPVWGFFKSFLGGGTLELKVPLECGVIQGVIYKFYPAVIHVQSQIECALKLHAAVAHRIDDIAAIDIRTHQEVMAKIVKSGPLRNPADRDHCLQYSVAVALLKGSLTAADYEDEAAANPRIDQLRELMTVTPDEAYTARFRDVATRANPASIEVRFRDGTSSGRIEAIYPVGHPDRRSEALPLFEAKFRAGLALRYPVERQQQIAALCFDHARLLAMPVHAFTDLLAV